MSLHCEPCGVKFNGINPFRDHMNSEKHKKKINQCASAFPMENSLDEYIEKHGNEYKCIACKVTLNGYQPAQSHVAGRKHRISIHNDERSFDSIQKTAKISNVQGSRISSTYKDTELSHIFSFHNIIIKNVLSDLKVIRESDPVCF